MKEIRCKVCNREFERFAYLVVGRNSNDEEMYMCENCFFELALKKFNCKSVIMDDDCENYFDPKDDPEYDF